MKIESRVFWVDFAMNFAMNLQELAIFLNIDMSSVYHFVYYLYNVI